MFLVATGHDTEAHFGLDGLSLAISFPVIRLVVTHSIILALIAWVLFRSDTRRYFGPLKSEHE